ncbi:hypothetical protein G7066_13575 [Leucobacter coleopterorum]|uniref:Type VII secretion integral membrane protein EccD n=1 Tax=Leucobacter coleopterorum TaxID=2714933 RepID=A0ABX6JYE6_9MICO|nr:hypothetical protein [Leucobacter coleopterorum]QIM19345.1 hypothetical protein G7066_13575 [Leucobacter coleopterorum]
MSKTSTPLRRIALFASGERHDLVVPKGDVLTHALAAAGVYLGDADQVLGPDGSRIDPTTSAVDLREGGLYSVTRAVAFREASNRRVAGALTATRTLPWALVACATTATFMVIVSGDLQNRWVAAVVVAVAAVIVALTWGLRGTDKTKLSSAAPFLVLGALAGVLAVPVATENFETLVVAAGSGSAAILTALVGFVAPVARVRAAASSVVVLAVLLAAAALASSALAVDLRQLTLAVAGASVVALRALPSLLVNVDEGYFIDYGKFMVLRWTARGRVPEYISAVEEKTVRQLVANAEARLQALTLLLSLFAGLGFPAATLTLAAPNLIEQIAAAAFLVFAVLGLLLTSRRTVAPDLQNPPRIAVLLGSIVFTLIFAMGSSWAYAPLLGAALIAIGVFVAVLSVSFARGNRSLGWSRTGDIFDSLAIAFVLPAALLAAGTLELLQGVLS